jgi:hypothetical protein
MNFRPRNPLPLIVALVMAIAAPAIAAGATAPSGDLFGVARFRVEQHNSAGSYGELIAEHIFGKEEHRAQVEVLVLSTPCVSGVPCRNVARGGGTFPLRRTSSADSYA